MKYKGVPIHQITLPKHPLLYLELLQHLLLDLLFWFKDFFIRKFLLIFALITIYALVTYVPLLHVPIPPTPAHQSLPVLRRLLGPPWRRLLHRAGNRPPYIRALPWAAHREGGNGGNELRAPPGDASKQMGIRPLWQMRMYFTRIRRNKRDDRVLRYFAGGAVGKLSVGLRDGFGRTAALLCGQKSSRH